MNSQNTHLYRFTRVSSSVTILGITILLTATCIAAQTRTAQPQSNPSKRQPIAVLRASESREGSRVAISSDQSLNNYEAYRRGDRFYVKIPAADVPRAEGVHGRGFAGVQAQRAGDSTVLSFRLQPGATAHVEQRGNRLDVVVTVPGGGAGVASKRTGESSRLNPTGPARASDPMRRNAVPAGNRSETTGISPTAPEASSQRQGAGASGKASATPTPSTGTAAKPSGTPKAMASPSGGRGTLAQTSPSASPLTNTTAPATTFWRRLRNQADYWILLAQLNPIPVAVGAGLLLLAIGLLLIRRRSKSTQRAKPAPKTEVKAASVAEELPVVAAAPVPTDEVTEPIITPEPPATTAQSVETPQVVVAPAVSASTDARRERVALVADEAKKLLEGGNYDESLIGSTDRETRRLVGAELLSALVGRNPQRRERAREAFMKHGYFDDATSDLRIAESDNERAAAARRLSFVHDREATPHLIGALSDSAPDVRRAAVEALMDLRDPAAIGPLNSLIQNETDRKVPRPLIQRAIEACATSTPEERAAAGAASAPQTISQSSQAVETEREVIEI